MSGPPPDRVLSFMRKLKGTEVRRGRCPACTQHIGRYDETETVNGKRVHKRCAVFSTERKL